MTRPIYKLTFLEMPNGDLSVLRGKKEIAWILGGGSGGTVKATMAPGECEVMAAYVAHRVEILDEARGFGSKTLTETLTDETQPTERIEL